MVVSLITGLVVPVIRCLRTQSELQQQLETIIIIGEHAVVSCLTICRICSCFQQGARQHQRIRMCGLTPGAIFSTSENPGKGGEAIAVVGNEKSVSVSAPR